MLLRKRPLPISVISALFVAVGAVGLAYHVTELDPRRPFEWELLWVLLLRLLAVVGGVYLWLGRCWARWLLFGWMAYHIVLSAFHSMRELGMHTVLFGVVTFFLLRPGSVAWLRRTDMLSDNAIEPGSVSGR